MIGFVRDNITVTEGTDRSLNLTVEVISGELGMDVAVGIIPGATTMGIAILCMITVLYLHHTFLIQIFGLVVTEFSSLVHVQS